ncbi:MAG: DUF192 domain-containing protein [Candidatus Omnitrophota bacterium]
MKIINKTKNTVLAEEAVIADTLFKRLKGLLGRRYLREAEALLITPCNSIHTLFMHFAIDVVFVDKACKVVKTIPYLKPFRITRPYFKADFVLELPAGTIASSSTTPGDTLSLT